MVLTRPSSKDEMISDYSTPKSVVSIPQNKFGDAVKPKSITGFDNSHNSTIRFSDVKKTHEYGHIINELTSSTFIKSSDILLDLKLDGSDRDYSGFDNQVNPIKPYKYNYKDSG